MSLIHSLAAHARGGLAGLQANQRDWSPFVAHFTSYAAMERIRSAIRDRASPDDVASLLDEADRASFETVAKIADSGALLTSHPAGIEEIPRCVCFTESTLPGLIAHCERYGRFGFIFEKARIFDLGGRPCAYLGHDQYGLVKSVANAKGPGTPEHLLLGLSNRLTPPGHGRIQDFTHEREWRLFGDLALDPQMPSLLVTPLEYVGALRERFGADRIYLPIDVLFEWGA